MQRLSLNVEFHDFSWLSLVGSFFRAGLHCGAELASQGGFCTLLLYFPPFHFYEIFLHFLLPVGNGGETLQTERRQQRLAHRQGKKSSCATNRRHALAVAEVHLPFRHGASLARWLYPPAWTASHSQPKPRASHQLLPPSAQHRPASPGCWELHFA